MEEKLRLVDLCTGTGAFSIALSEYTRCVFANDFYREAELIFNENHEDQGIK